jgi:hypothetical protein
MIKESMMAALLGLTACAAPDAQCVSFAREGTVPCYSSTIIVPVQKLSAAEAGDERLKGSLSSVAMAAILLLVGRK